MTTLQILSLRRSHQSLGQVDLLARVYPRIVLDVNALQVLNGAELPTRVGPELRQVDVHREQEKDNGDLGSGGEKSCIAPTQNTENQGLITCTIYYVVLTFLQSLS